MSERKTAMRRTRGGLGRAAAAALVAAVLAWAGRADAAVAFVSGFSTTPLATAAPNAVTWSSGNLSVTPGAGTNRVLVVAVTMQLGSAGTFSASATYNGATATQGTVTAASTTRGVWIGYFKEANLPAASANLVVTVNSSQSFTGVSVFAATFSGVDQTTPLSGNNQVSGNATTITVPAAVTSNAGGAYVAAVARATGATDTIGPATFTTTANGTNVGSNVGYKLTAAAASEQTTSTLSAAGVQSLGVVALNPAATSVTIGNGSAEPASASVSSGQVGPIDAFSVQASAGTATITALTVNLTAGNAALTNLFVNATAACTGTTYGTLASPAAGNNTITLTTNLGATTTSGTTNLYVCGTAATVAASTAVTGNVASVTASGYTSIDADTTNATLTVAPPPVLGTTTGTLTATASSCSQVSLSASYTGDADGDNTVTFSRSVDGGATFANLTSCTSVGGGANPRACVDATVAASTSYVYRALFADATGGVSGTNPLTSVTVGTPACAANLVLSNPGGQPATGTLTVGAATWTWVGQLALAASSGSLTLDRIAVSNGAAAPLAAGADLQLALVDPTGTGLYATGSWDGARWVFGTITDPASGLPVTVTTTPTTFRVYAGANYGAAAGESFAMQLAPANVVALAPATATTGASFTASSFTVGAPAVVNEGSPSSTTAPMVSIVNPGKATAVSGNFLVQIYVFSGNGSAITAMGLTTDGSTPTCAANDATIAKDSHVYGSASSAMYSKLVSGLVAGTYTLKACATNGAGTLVSAPVTVTVRAARTGDGNLLVRDNGAQLCTDCHAQSKIQTHSSESTQSKYGTWSTTCRDCHTPHSTRNLYLVREQIVPPSTTSYQAARNVYLATKTGDSNVSGATSPASSSFANSDASGVCQVCHTRTMSSARTYTNGTFTGASTTIQAASSVFVSGTAPAGDVNNWVLGPDGRTYQIAAVVSGTQATLASAYQGTTTGAGTARFVVGPSRWRNTGNQDTHYTAGSSAGTSACTGCHSHSKGFAGGESSGGSNCSGCHGTIWNTMNGATAGVTSKHALGNVVGTNDRPADDAAVNWGTQTSLATITPAQRSCVNMCHDDHVHDLSPGTTHEQDVYTDARSSTSRAMTRDASGNVTAGTPAKTDFTYSATTQAWGGMCTSCHQTQVDANRPAIAAAQFSGGGHDGVTTSDGTTTYTWSYQLHDGSTFNRNCTKCHASRGEGTTPTFAASGSSAVAVHGTSDPSLLAGGTSAQNAATAPLVCWNCHGSAASPAAGAQGNRSGKDVQAASSKAYGHPVATTDARHNTVTERTAAWNGGQFSGTNRHAACADCHDPHEAGKTRHANGSNAVATTSPLYGVSGVGFTSPATNWNGGAAMASGSYTWKDGVTTRIAAEYELCLKCHSSFAFGATPPTGTTGASSTAVETDQSLEFSTANQSYHPVVGALPATDPGANGSSRLTAAQLCTSTTCTTAGSQNWTPGQTMYCSDCHGNDTASPAVQGPHGSSVKYVLKGPNRCWPYTASGTTCTTTLQGLGTNPTSNTFLAGNFCLNCHPLRSNSATNNATAWSGNVVHYNHSGPQVSNALCVQCHILVPHGGKVSRLIATATAGLPARYQVSGTPPSITQFAKASTPGGYSQSNCNTSCGGHGAVTAPETW